MDKESMNILKQLLEGQRSMSDRLESIEQKLDIVTDGTVRLREDITEIKEGLSSVEMVTARNWADIARLKVK